MNMKLTDRKIIAFAIAWDVIFTALVPVMDLKYSPNSLNLTFASLDYRAVMYLHGLIVAYVATLALVICELVKINGHSLQGRERTLIRYSALIGILLGGIGGIVNFGYISASGVGVVNDLPNWVQVVSFLMLDEIAVALLYFLITAPKVAGMKYKNAGLAYYLLTFGVASAFIAAIMGHIGGYVIQYGSLPGPLNNYVSWLGLSDTTFATSLITSHSHEMVVALLAIIVALAALNFGYSKLGTNGKLLARLGLTLSILGVILMTGIYIISGLYNYVIPALFTSGPNGVNGLALDDILTGLVGAGAALLAIALIGPWYKKVYGANPAKIAVFTTWLITILTVPVIGYYMEFRSTYFGANGLIPNAPGRLNDQVYTSFHQQLAFFVLPAFATMILAMDFYLKSKRKKTILSISAISGCWLAFIGGIAYTFISPSGINIFKIVEYTGAAIIALSGLAVALYLFGILKDE